MITFNPNMLRTSFGLVASILLASASLPAAESASVGNDLIARNVSWDSGRFSTTTIANRVGQSQVQIAGGNELSVTIRLGASTADRRLAADFTVTGSQSAREIPRSMSGLPEKPSH